MRFVRSDFTTEGCCCILALLFILPFVALAESAQNASLEMEVRDEHGSLYARIEKDGVIRGRAGEKLGSIQDSGVVRDKNGSRLGSFDKDGDLRDHAGSLVGRVGNEGELRNKSGAKIGEIKKNGDIRDSHGGLVGRVKPYDNGSRIKVASFIAFFTSWCR